MKDLVLAALHFTFVLNGNYLVDKNVGLQLRFKTCPRTKKIKKN